MKPEQLEAFIKELVLLTPQAHINIFNQIKNVTHDRLSEDAERLADESKELQEFIKTKLS